MAWGYNAYALGIDGHDEFGRFLPHDYLESFGDYKPPMYAYLDILPVKLFGLTPFAARFPSALFGVLTVLMTYFLVKRIFSNSSNKEYYALAASFILALSPWHIMLSRAAFEANVATFFLVTGIYCFIAGIQERRKFLLLSAISFVLSVYTFNSARVAAPLIIIAFTICSYKKLLQRKKEVIMACIIGLLILLPALPFLFSPQAKIRFQEVNIFSDVSVIKSVNQEIVNDNNATWSKVLHNRRLAYAVLFLQHYFDNLNPDFLFIKGDGNPKFSTQDVGELYLWDLPFFIAGIFLLFKKREGYWWVVPIWLILGIIPAATARETPHALRIETIVPTFQIFVAYGFVQLIQRIKLKKIAIFLLFFILFFNVLYFQHGYFTHYPREYSGEWQLGYADSIAYVTQVKDKYDQINITDALGRPYIYYLFGTKTDPHVYRKTAVISRDTFGFVTVHGFDKYQFMKNPNQTNNTNKKILFINTPGNIPSQAHILKTFYLLNGDSVLEAYIL